MKKTDVTKIINNIFYYAKDTIVELVKADVNGTEKKAILDKRITSQIIALFDGYLKTKNPVLFLIKKIVLDYIIANVPAITQGIYNMIKTRVEGITDAK